MKIIGVIPARAESSRFYNKPLALILGKPMIQWVYEHAKASKKIDEVYIATDSEEISKIKNSLFEDMPANMDGVTKQEGDFFQ